MLRMEDNERYKKEGLEIVINSRSLGDREDFRLWILPRDQIQWTFFFVFTLHNLIATFLFLLQVLIQFFARFSIFSKFS